MKIVLIGIQGSGKSTQGNLMAKKLGIPYLSSGHIFRNMAKEKTPLGRYIKETINAGFLIPDDKTIEIIEEYLKKPEYTNGYILDGFPRTPKQAQAFKEPDAVIHLDVSDKEALWRLSGRVEEGVREDNTLQAIRKRIENFHTHTQPLIDYYKKRHLLLQINGERDIDTIFQDILAQLKAKTKRPLPQ
ncbi:MAG: nucleoside monophosphate kinase [Candidatus Chisholmbacteria bacterium]|nr:nucleoside monophosphate kinase [Candidatus Chisholmbacteria bacterium]